MSESQSRKKQSAIFQCAGLVEAGHPWFTIDAEEFAGHINVRADPDNPALMNDVERVLGVSLPRSPNTLSHTANLPALWLAPDEWLIVETDDAAAERKVIDANRDLAGARVAVTDVSSGQILLILRGSGAREALARGCPLDLHPRVFKFGQCAQTVLNHVNITLWPSESGDINVIVRRSFADFVYRWFVDIQSRA